MQTEVLQKEITYKAIKSSGPGGQHVNKTASKIELTFDINGSNGLSENEKERLINVLKSKLSSSNMLILQCDTSRSQHRNKEIVLKRFLDLISKALLIPKKRKASNPTKPSIKKRLENKKKLGLRKALRKKPPRE
jgi:ribosome-associated protein